MDTPTLSPKMRKAAIKALVRGCQMAPRTAATYLDTNDHTVVPDGFRGHARRIANAYLHGDEPGYTDDVAHAIAHLAGGQPCIMDDLGRWGVSISDSHDGRVVTVQSYALGTSSTKVFDGRGGVTTMDTGLPRRCTDVLRVADRLAAIAHQLARHPDGSDCDAPARFHLNLGTLTVPEGSLGRMAVGMGGPVGGPTTYLHADDNIVRDDH